MAPSIPENSLPKITNSIWELERLIKDCKWWQIDRKIKYQNKLVNLRVLAFEVGLNTAINDLVKMGILKESPSQNEI